MKLRIWPFVALLTAFALGWISSCHHERKAREGANPPLIDTLIIERWNTVKVDSPIYIESRALKDSLHALVAVNQIQSSLIDSLLAYVSEPMDTTIDVVLPREQRVYRDTSYTAWVSGYYPALDSIQVRQRATTQVITLHDYAPPKRWSIGIHAGYGVMPIENRIYAAPYIGVGLSYNILNF